MCTLGELKTSLTKRLNDAEPGFENQRWCIEQVHDYLISAITTVANANPSSFTREKEIALSEGCFHCVCDDCDEVVAVISVGGENCDVPSETSDIYSGFGQHYSHLCTTNDDDVNAVDPGSISLDKNAPCCFRTENSIDAGTVAKVLCYKTPDYSEASDTTELGPEICSKHRAQIMSFAMADARLLDSESELGIAASRAHLEMATIGRALRNDGN